MPSTKRKDNPFSELQVLFDKRRAMGQFILTGSQNLSLLPKVSQSLAGISAILELLPFSINELRQAGSLPNNLDQLLTNGFYPALFDRKIDSSLWIDSYISTYLERDARQLAAISDLNRFRRFTTLCALFETMVINEFLKARRNGGSRQSLHFWRDHLGTEVDLVLERGDAIAGIEIKSSSHISNDALRHLNFWTKYAGSYSKNIYRGVVYAGAGSYQTEDHARLVWSDL